MAHPKTTRGGFDMALNSEQLSTYAEDGFLVVRDVLPPDVLTRVRDAIGEVTAEAQAGRAKRAGSVLIEPGAEGGTTAATATVKAAPLRKLNALVPNDPFFHSVASNPHILDMAAQLIGHPQHIMLYSDQVFLKP